MRKVVLPSGAALQITPAPFQQAKALYQALLAEMRVIPLGSLQNKADLYKDLFCIGFSSPSIDACLKPCLERCTYEAGNCALRIDDDTFEPEKARGDYMKVCIEVAKENVGPFMSGLYAEYVTISKMAVDTPQ